MQYRNDFTMQKNAGQTIGQFSQPGRQMSGSSRSMWLLK
jgi:hypothetical protein